MMRSDISDLLFGRNLNGRVGKLARYARRCGLIPLTIANTMLAQTGSELCDGTPQIRQITFRVLWERGSRHSESSYDNEGHHV